MFVVDEQTRRCWDRGRPRLPVPKLTNMDLIGVGSLRRGQARTPAVPALRFTFNDPGARFTAADRVDGIRRVPDRDIYQFAVA